MDDRIIVDRAEGIGSITLNRPDQHNAMNFDMWRALGEAAHDLGSDDSVKVVVLAGAGGKAFSAGADIKDFPAHRSSTALAREYAIAFEGSMDYVEQMPKPVIAMIGGICVGGGCELATATDIRIASENSTFGIPIAKIGVLAGYDETRRLIRLVGAGNAKHLLLTAKIVDAHEALRIGLIGEVVPDNRLHDHTYELAARMVHFAPMSQSGHKRIVRTVLDNPSLTGLSPEDAEFPLTIFDTEDGMEGYHAFVDKRTPRFTGR
jgi:enoyl-CoA hydratase/carnithine racemase